MEVVLFVDIREVVGALLVLLLSLWVVVVLVVDVLEVLAIGEVVLVVKVLTLVEVDVEVVVVLLMSFPRVPRTFREGEAGVTQVDVVGSCSRDEAAGWQGEADEGDDDDDIGVVFSSTARHSRGPSLGLMAVKSKFHFSESALAIFSSCCLANRMLFRELRAASAPPTFPKSLLLTARPPERCLCSFSAQMCARNPLLVNPSTQDKPMVVKS